MTSVAARTPASRAARDASRLRRGHRGDRLVEPLAGRLVPVVEDAEPERLGQGERGAGRGGVVAQQAVGVGEAGDGEAVLRLRVVDAVPAGQVGSRPRRRCRRRRAAPRAPARTGSCRAASRAG